MSKNFYICYAAISHDGQSIFEYNQDVDADSGEMLEWFSEWHFDMDIVPDCAYSASCKDFLRNDLNRLNIDAQIKKYKITVEELSDG